jgi:hypothetical protein
MFAAGRCSKLGLSIPQPNYLSSGYEKGSKENPALKAAGFFNANSVVRAVRLLLKVSVWHMWPNPFGSAVFLQTCLIPEFVNQFRASAFVSSSDRDL